MGTYVKVDGIEIFYQIQGEGDPLVLLMGFGADGNTWEKNAFVVTVANAGQYGNNAWISPHADIADGKLDLCIVSPFPKILAPQLVYQLFNRTMDRNKYVKIQKVESVEIESPEFDYVHLDGESLRIKNKLKIEINPSSLRVLVP